MQRPMQAKQKASNEIDASVHDFAKPAHFLIRTRLVYSFEVASWKVEGFVRRRSKRRYISTPTLRSPCSFNSFVPCPTNGEGIC